MPAGGCLQMQLGPAPTGRAQVHLINWAKTVLMLVIFHLQEKWTAYAKEVKYMVRCLGHVASVIL